MAAIAEKYTTAYQAKIGVMIMENPINEKNSEPFALDDLQLPSGDCPNCGASPDKREIAGDEKYPEYETTIRVLKCECGAVVHETFTLTKIEIVRIDDEDIQNDKQ